MDNSSDRELLLFRNRIRRFSENLIKDENRIYKEFGIDIPIRNIRVLNVLDSAGKPLSITEVANAIDRTHPDIHYISLALYKKGLIKNVKDRQDHRKRLITLSPKGLELVEKMKPIWQATIEATAEWIYSQAPDFLNYLKSLEQSLASESYFDKILKRLKVNYEQNIDISTFKKSRSEEEDIANFYNRWASEFRPVKELEQILNQIKTNIINRGGQVFFGSIDNTVEGISVLQRLSFDRIQLLFLYVLPDARRKHIASKLMKETIKFSSQIGCKQILCYTNKILVPINVLLDSFGFEPSSLVQKNYLPYENLPHTMILNLRK